VTNRTPFPPKPLAKFTEETIAAAGMVIAFEPLSGEIITITRGSPATYPHPILDRAGRRA
jgi:hypothetical protein